MRNTWLAQPIHHNERVQTKTCRSIFRALDTYSLHTGYGDTGAGRPRAARMKLLTLKILKIQIDSSSYQALTSLLMMSRLRQPSIAHRLAVMS
eukprot:7249531-Prymnesium_polylepis.1